MNPSASVLQSARKEARFVIALWLACCVYTVGYAGLFAYRREELPRLVLGMPEWVVWGIVAPWLVSTLITCWYALWGMRDEDLGEERATGGEHGEDRAHE
jgi:hypothetical protein